MDSCPKNFLLCPCPHHNRQCTCQPDKLDPDCKFKQINWRNHVKWSTIYSKETGDYCCEYLITGPPLNHICTCGLLCPNNYKRMRFDNNLVDNKAHLNLEVLNRDEKTTRSEFFVEDWIQYCFDNCQCGGVRLLSDIARELHCHRQLNNIPERSMQEGHMCDRPPECNSDPVLYSRNLVRSKTANNPSFNRILMTSCSSPRVDNQFRKITIQAPPGFNNGQQVTKFPPGFSNNRKQTRELPPDFYGNWRRAMPEIL